MPVSDAIISCFLFKLITGIQLSEFTLLNFTLRYIFKMVLQVSTLYHFLQQRTASILSTSVSSIKNIYFIHFYLVTLKIKETLAKHDVFITGKNICVLGGKFQDLLLLRLLAVSFFLKLVNVNLLDRYI